MRVKLLLFTCLLWVWSSCNSDKGTKTSNEKKAPARVVNVPKFNGDSAYFFVKKQVDFGPRIPNTKAHHAAGDFFIRTFKRYGAIVTVQDFESPSYDGQKLFLRNIIASYYPEKQKRILLAAHWDTRPFADRDKEKPSALFDGANDGASGVGVLLEMARILGNATAPEVGIDIILFDGEDYGEKDDERQTHPLPAGLVDWWCLGSQYWTKHKHKPNYAAYYGVLLDMVGGKNAQFYREGFSLQYAPSIVEKVWNRAAQLGHSHLFAKRNDGQTTDDHLYVNEIGKIPMINIINFDLSTGSFGGFHHTTKDNMELISKETLQAVGETLMNVVYYEE